MNTPTIFNPQYVIELRRTLNQGLQLCDTLEKFSGIGGISHTGTTGVTGRKHSAATIRKMKLAAKNRKLQVHQGGNARAA